MTRRTKISIIIPVYNEFRSLPEVLDRVVAAPLPEGCDREIIVVDDGSTDGTTDILDGYKNSPLIRVHHSVVNFGKGAAIRVGLAKATGDIILVQDGDLEYDPNDYIRVLEPIVRGDSDVVYGSRFQGDVQGMALPNLVANKILTTAANVLYGAHLTDEATAYKAFRAEALEDIRLSCLRFEFCPEVTAKLRRIGYRIDEVPITYNGRSKLEGKKIRARDGFHALWTLMFHRVSPMSWVVKDPTLPKPGDREPRKASRRQRDEE